MGSLVEFFSNEFQNQVIGVVTGTFGSNQFPDMPLNLVMFKARSSNSGSFFIGTASGTASLPWQLAAGESTPWIPVVNLNKLWHNHSSGTVDLLEYWGIR
jgi:hypothetical protein